MALHRQPLGGCFYSSIRLMLWVDQVQAFCSSETWGWTDCRSMQHFILLLLAPYCVCMVEILLEWAQTRDVGHWL